MSRQLVQIAAFLVLLVVEFTPGCHGKTSRKNTDDAVDLDLQMAVEDKETEEREDADTDETLWGLAKRVADLVNRKREVDKGALEIHSKTHDAVQVNNDDNCFVMKAIKEHACNADKLILDRCLKRNFDKPSLCDRLAKIVKVACGSD